MTLALYGKSRRRVQGLVFGAFMAVIMAAILGVSVVTVAFAHHLEGDVDLATCDNGQEWSLDVWQGGWSSYREAVLTLTDATTPVSLPFTPFLDNGPDGDGILSVSGTGTVHTAGKIEQYTGSFSEAGYTDTSSTDINSSTTSLVHSGGTAWNANFVAGAVMRWDNELMLITARSGDGKTLTVVRGFGESNDNSHSNNSQGVWKRGALEGSPNTFSWDIDFDESDCFAKIIIKKVVTGAGADANQQFTADIDNESGGNEGSESNVGFSANTPADRDINFDSGDTEDDFNVTEDPVPANWALTGKKVLAGDASCETGTWTTVSGTTAGDRRVDFNVEDSEVFTVCFRNAFTAPAQGNVIIGKVWDSTGAAADSTDFAGTVGAANWSAISFGEFTSPIQVPANVSHTADETSPTAGWTEVGWAAGTYGGSPTAQHTCPTTKSSYTGNADINTTVGANQYVVLCVMNTKAPNPSVSVVKSDDTGGAANLNETFNFFLDVTVANGPTVADYGINDDVPNAFTVNSVTVTDLVNTPDKLSCNNADPVDCTLAAGAATGSGGAAGYRITINVTVNPGTSCNETYNNVARSDTQQELSSDTIEVDGCGSSSFVKSDGTLHGDHVDWTITITNTSVLADTVTIIDSGTSLESDTCTNTVSESPADTYECDVPGSGTNGGVATLVLSTPLPQDYDPVCDSILVENTAQDSDTQQTDGGVYSDTAEPDAGCLDVTKTLGIATPPTWTVSVTSTADTSVEVVIDDDNAFFQGVVSGGTCPGVANGTDMSSGIVCTINANSTLIITVAKLTPPATCEGTDVPNSVSIWFGRVAEGAPDDSADGGTHQDVNADKALCNQVIQVCKVWRANAIINPATNFAFDFSDSSEEVPAVQQHSIFGVSEGDADGECILLEVSPGQVNINEIVPPGFILEGYTILQGDAVDDDLTPAALFGNLPEPWHLGIDVPSQQCSGGLVSEDPTLLGVVRDIAALVVEVDPPQDILCTITFFNRDDGVTLNDGQLRIEKYRDVDGDGDADDPSIGEGVIIGWDMTVAGPDVNETTPTGAPGHPADALFYPGLIAGDIYNVTEEMPAGWTVTNVTIDGVSVGATTVAGTSIPNGGTRVIRFYNQQLGSINIHKEAQTRHNGVDSAAPNDDDGWTITLVSLDCDINFVGQTDANGNLSFTGLPLCTDYVVTEVGPNALSPGFVQVAPAGPFTNQTPGGQTLTFLNRRTTSDPPCQDCRQPTITPSPTNTPTATPTTPTGTPTTPTATPTTPPAGSSPSVTIIAGEKTPGPGQTPIAPSAGDGMLGDASGGLNVLLMLAGLAALSAGLGVLALGRRK